MAKTFLGSFVVFCLLLVLSSCSSDPEPINFGVDNCDYCKMTISDNRYGAELVTNKGRKYKFDDLHCIKAFVDDEHVKAEQVRSMWLVDFSVTEKLIPAENSYLLQNERLQSPMGSNIAAFENADSIAKYQSTYSGIEIKWEEFLRSSH